MIPQMILIGLAVAALQTFAAWLLSNSAGLGWREIYYIASSAVAVGIFTGMNCGNIANRKLKEQYEKAKLKSTYVFDHDETLPIMIVGGKPQIRFNRDQVGSKWSVSVDCINDKEYKRTIVNKSDLANMRLAKEIQPFYFKEVEKTF